MDTKKLKNLNDIDLKIAGFRIISKIGEGGMSVVYLAEQLSLKREVAIKVMRLEIASNEVDVQRFKHEAKTIARLDHPNIINIYNIGQTKKGEVFFTMPYLNHGDFSSYILEDELEFIELLKSICDGLGFAHQHGVIHRDIKPENLLFDKFGNTRIADFGIAISKDGTRMTKEHQIVGSAQYMSPEQARSLKVDVHSDIYSLGIVIYERLTGEVPFDGDDSITILVNHVSAEVPKLSSKMRHWQPLIDKCLAKNPEARYQSMLELKKALIKIPTSSFQRTGSSIQNIFADEKGKHLKWFIPSLFLLLIIGVFGLNQDEKELDPITKTPEIVKAGKSVKIVEPVVIELVENNKKEEQPSQEKPIQKEDETSNSLNDINNVSNQGVNTSKEVLVTGLGTQESLLPNIANIVPDETVLQWPYDQENLDAIETSKASNDVDGIISEIEILLEKANINIKKYQLSKPASNNATDQLLAVIKLEPRNEKALKGLESVGGKYYQLIKSSLEKYDFNTAIKHSRSLKRFSKKIKYINKNLETQVTEIKKTISTLNIDGPSISTAKIKTLMRIVALFSPEDILISQLNAKARLKSGPQIGEGLIDELGMETIVLQANFAVSKNEVTLEQYSKFAKETNYPSAKCKHKGGGVNSFFGKKTWEKPFFNQNPGHPIVCVTQADAVAYAQWLSKQTGNKYRLPTQQEWQSLAVLEYNKFVPCKTANLTGNEAKKIRNKDKKFNCSDNFRFTAPVGSYEKNKQGLYDIQGNVSEWVSDSTIAMGSSWLDGITSNKLDKNQKLPLNSAFSYIGFRLVRNL